MDRFLERREEKEGRKEGKEGKDVTLRLLLDASSHRQDGIEREVSDKQALFVSKNRFEERKEDGNFWRVSVRTVRREEKRRESRYI